MKRLPLIILAAALLPSLAIIWSRLDQRSERAADADLLMLIHDYHQSSGEGITRSVVDLRGWLAAHGSHSLAPILKKGFWWYDHDAQPATQGFRSGQLETHLQLSRAMISHAKP
jgi:hypothetical protein